MHPTTHCCLTALPGQSKIAVMKRLLADYAKVWAIMLVVLCSEQFKLDQVITKKHRMSAKMKQEQKESQEFAKLMKDLQMGKEQSLAHLQLRLSEVHLSLTSLHAVHSDLCFCSTSANTCNCHAYSNGVRQSLCARRLCHSSSHSVRLKRRKALCRIVLQTTSRELSICIARANSSTCIYSSLSSHMQEKQDACRSVQTSTLDAELIYFAFTLSTKLTAGQSHCGPGKTVKS